MSRKVDRSALGGIWRSTRVRASVAGGLVLAVAGLVVPIHQWFTTRETSISALQTADAATPAASTVEPSPATPTPSTVAPSTPEEQVQSPEATAAKAAPAVAQYEGIKTSHDQGASPWYDDGGAISLEDISEFPISDEDSEDYFGCTEEQLEWLDAHGVAAPNSWSLEEGGPEYTAMEEHLLNTATSGGALSLRNLRVEGEFLDPPVRIGITCGSSEMGGAVPPIFAMATMGDSAPFVFINNPWGEMSYSADLIGTPVVANIAPGEILQMYLYLDTLDPTRDFEGRVVMDVAVGDKDYEYVIREGYLHVAPPAIDTVYVLVQRGRLYCGPSPETFDGYLSDLASLECSPEELAELVVSDWPTYPGSVSLGDTGNTVQQWQEILIQAGIIADNTANRDGWYGDGTQAAIDRYLAGRDAADYDGYGVLGSNMYDLITG